jgi:large subunit ribosomal protein L13
VDAEGETLGRLATRIATVLRGKHKPQFTPHVDTGDFVIVLNASKINLTGRKLEQKHYYRFTGYLGHLKAHSAQHVREHDPERMVLQAVRGMLPKNRLSRHIVKKLKVYPGAEHPHAAQQPVAFPDFV